jgi:ribosomal protein S27E
MRVRKDRLNLTISRGGERCPCCRGWMHVVSASSNYRYEMRCPACGLVMVEDGGGKEGRKRLVFLRVGRAPS